MGSSGPTIHTGDIKVSETWSKEGNPHIIRQRVMVKGQSTPILTIGPGVEVRFENGAYLEVGRGDTGGLIVNGTQEEPVTMVGDSENASAGFWQNIAFWSGTTPETRLTWLEMRHCGSANGCIFTNGGFAFDVQHVKIHDSAEYGVYLEGETRFGTASEDLQVLGAAQYAVRMHPDSVGTLPTGTYKGSALPGVLIREGTMGRSATWPKIDAPYVIAERVMVKDASDAKLTLLPGTEIRFKPLAYLEIGRGGPGALIAEGTATEKIRFTADATTPSAGFHKSVDIWGLPQANKIDHVEVEYGDSGIWFSKDPAPVITNSKLANNSSCGIGFYSTATNTVDFTAASMNNVFEGNGKGAVCVE